MIELPVCRWRREPTLAGRHACVSPKIITHQRGVRDEQCLTCWCRDHEPPRRPAGPCLHLGARAGMASCAPCAAEAGHPVQIPAHHCALHGRCTIAQPVPALKCCAHCGDRADRPPSAQAGAVRHLTYFCCPLGNVWQWNLRQLKERIGLFNGARNVFVVQGPALAPLPFVQKELEGCGVNWLVADNDPVLKEYVGFPSLIRSVSQYTGEADVTFYGHAKGVSSEAWGDGVRQWTDSMYSGLLDYWPAVQRELARACCCGLWRKRAGWFPASPSTWHFAGSYRWVRNADLYSRNWDEYYRDWCCPEDYTGRHFKIQESACLYGDMGGGLNQLYAKGLWDQWAEGERRGWEASHLGDRWRPLLTTIILTAHAQEELVHDAIRSVLAQTSDAWELLILNSGLIDPSRYKKAYGSDARIRVAPTGETEEQRRALCMQGWAINEAFRLGLVRGDLVTHLSDDDVLSPDHVGAVQVAAREQPDRAAWYRAAARVELLPDGQERQLGELGLVGTGRPGNLLGMRIDGLQVSCRRSAWLPWTEVKELAPRADAVWMDAVAERTPIYELPGQCGRHRHTPNSTFTRPHGTA